MMHTVHNTMVQNTVHTSTLYTIKVQNSTVHNIWCPPKSKVPTTVHTKVYSSWCTLPIAPGRVWQSLALQRMLLSGFLEPSFTAI